MKLGNEMKQMYYYNSQKAINVQTSAKMTQDLHQ